MATCQLELSLAAPERALHPGDSLTLLVVQRQEIVLLRLGTSMPLRALATASDLDIITVTVYINRQAQNVRPHPPPDTDPAPDPAIHCRDRNAADAGRNCPGARVSFGQRRGGASAGPGPQGGHRPRAGHLAGNTAEGHHPRADGVAAHRPCGGRQAHLFRGEFRVPAADRSGSVSAATALPA